MSDFLDSTLCESVSCDTDVFRTDAVSWRFVLWCRRNPDKQQIVGKNVLVIDGRLFFPQNETHLELASLGGAKIVAITEVECEKRYGFGVWRLQVRGKTVFGPPTISFAGRDIGHVVSWESA